MIFRLCLCLLSAALPLPAAECFTKKAGDVPILICQAQPQKDQITLHLKDAQGQHWLRLSRLAEAETAAGRNIAMVMNAGMYHPNHNPVGLHIESGQTLARLNTEDAEGNFFLKPNGVFFIENGKAAVLDTERYQKAAPKPQLATQSGPMLVIDGKLHPAFTKGSANTKIRNGVGVDKAGTIFFAITEAPINLHDFAHFFQTTLHCPNALYFDGSVSRIYSERLQRTSQGLDLGPMIVVSEK